MAENSYPFYCWSGLLTEEHRKNMGQAIWLYLTLINMTTEEKNGIGLVLGGAAVTYQRIHEIIGISRDTYFRWLKILKDEGYINVKHTLRGNKIEITKSKRRKNRTFESTKNPTDENSSVREIGHSNVRNNGQLNVREIRHSYNKDDKPVKINQKDKTRGYPNSVGSYLPLSLEFHQKQKEDGLRHKSFKDLLTEESNIIITGAEELDRVQRLDGESIDDIFKVVNFILTDHNFWKGNVISLSSLRNESRNGNTKYFNCKNDMNSRGGMQNLHRGRHPIPNEEQQRKQYAGL